MPNMKPLRLSEIEDGRLREAVGRRLAAGLPGAWLLAVLAHSPEHARALASAVETVSERGALPARLKLLVQLLLSRLAGDRYSEAGLIELLGRAHRLEQPALEQILADYDESLLVDDRERLALRYAEQTYLDSKKVDDAFYTELRRLFPDEDIIELASLLALSYGVYRVTAALGAAPGQDADLGAELPRHLPR